MWTGPKAAEDVYESTGWIPITNKYQVNSKQYGRMGSEMLDHLKVYNLLITWYGKIQFRKGVA